MQKKIYYLCNITPLLLFSLLLGHFYLVGCKKDPCKRVHCQHGGTCVDGTCSCPDGYIGTYCEEQLDPCRNINCGNNGHCENGHCVCNPGYYGTYCENYDNCYGVTCYNGGYCSNGTCVCPPNYYGPHCEFYQAPATPVGIQITKVELVSFPAGNQNGFCWDGDGTCYADIYCTFFNNNGNNLMGTSCYEPNAAPGSYHFWSLSNCASFPDIVFTPLSARADIVMNDEDFGSSEYMFGYYFYPSDYSSTLPSVIHLQNSSTWHNAQIDLYVTWLY